MSATRHQRISARIATSGEVTIAGLADDFGVSEMTIRRDLEALEREGLIRRVRGGAISIVSRSYEPPLAERAASAPAAKRAIGRAAAALLADGEITIIDVGTTTLELARALSGHRKLTVVTPSLLVASELAKNPDVRTLVTGGILRPGEMSLVGHRAEDSFADLNCDTVFLGVGGVDCERGLTEYNLDDTRVKQAALKAARRCVVLADETKLGRVAFATVAPIARVDVLVTDARRDHPIVVQAADAGVEIVHAAAATQEEP
jgi:DeoR/GlpR family transcriptional regulator of sugar metabolism